MQQDCLQFQQHTPQGFDLQLILEVERTQDDSTQVVVFMCMLDDANGPWQAGSCPDVEVLYELRARPAGGTGYSMVSAFKDLSLPTAWCGSGMRVGQSYAWSRSVEDLVDQLVGEDGQLHLQAMVLEMDGVVSATVSVVRTRSHLIWAMFMQRWKGAQ